MSPIKETCKEEGGICSLCKYWKIMEFLPGNKGRCNKRDYIISCHHSCCNDFSEKKE
jgi:hypothetical protein